MVSKLKLALQKRCFSVAVITLLLSVAPCLKTYTQVNNALWCCIAEQCDPTKQDAVVDILKALINAKISPILTTNNLFNRLGNSYGKAIDQHWLLYNYKDEIAIMVPKDGAINHPFKNSLARKNFTATTFTQQKKLPTEITEDITKECLSELLDDDSNKPNFFFFTGHGSLLAQEKCSDEEEFITESLQCGMRLSSLLDIYHLLDQKGAQGVFCRTCYGSNPEVGTVLAKQHYHFPILSMCFGDTFSSFIPDGSMGKKLEDFHTTLQTIPCITQETQTNIFGALDILLDYKNEPNNIPCALWPNAPQFSVLHPTPSSSNTDSNVITAVDGTHILLQSTTDQVSLDLDKIDDPIITGGLIDRTNYTIKQLIISGECDLKKLASIFPNLRRARERDYTIKTVLVKGSSGIKKHQKQYHNAFVRCTEHFTRIVAHDDSNQPVSASKIW
ncbi:hypothetical protein KJZ61_00385 [Candidatus Dependentiae bacterium]|nr:hypothetical protein [Candidatus Dependentiae bacterium]